MLPMPRHHGALRMVALAWDWLGRWCILMAPWLPWFWSSLEWQPDICWVWSLCHYKTMQNNASDVSIWSLVGLRSSCPCFSWLLTAEVLFQITYLPMQGGLSSLKGCGLMTHCLGRNRFDPRQIHDGFVTDSWPVLLSHGKDPCIIHMINITQQLWSSIFCASELFKQDITISRSFWDLLGASEPLSGQIHLASTAPNMDRFDPSHWLLLQRSSLRVCIVQGAVWSAWCRPCYAGGQLRQTLRIATANLLV